MKRIIALDELIIKFYQKISNRFNRLTGIGNANYRLAYAMLSLYIGLSVLNSFLIGAGVLSVFYGFMVIFCGLFYKQIFDRQEQINAKLSETKPLNLMRHSDVFRFMRLIFIVVYPLWDIFLMLDPPLEPKYDFYIVRLVSIVYDLCFASAWYFIACDPLPPCKGRIREWLESFGRTPVEAKVRD
ncbi:TPA: hypothetical protein DF272_06750 [Candidatus Falkowbacteria bacterium]|nr:hypothetical protein [Candidatus Falkowbacteria bacterium]